MNPDNIKRNTVYLLITILLLALATWGVNFYLEMQKQEKIKTQSTEFVLKWANFRNETSLSYLNSIKPYMSPDFYKETQQSANELEKITKEGGYEPNISNFSVISGPTIKKQDKDYIVTIVGQREYVGVEKYKEKVELTWSKVDGEYLVSDINTEKQ